MSTPFSTLSVDEKLDRLYSTVLFEIQNNSKRHSELSTSVAQLKTEVSGHLEAFSDQINVLKVDIDEVKKHEAITVKRFTAMETTLNNIRQTGMECDLVISGIGELEKNNDELLSMVSAVLKFVKCDKQYIVRSATRIGKSTNSNSKKTTGPRSILVKTGSKEEKIMILKAKRKVIISADKVIFNGKPIGSSQDVIYFNENLTKLNGDIYFAALKLKKLRLVKYVWLRNGTTYIKEQDDSKVIQVSNPEQINSFRTKNNLNSTPIDDMFISFEDVNVCPSTLQVNNEKTDGKPETRSKTRMTLSKPKS